MTEDIFQAIAYPTDNEPGRVLCIGRRVDVVTAVEQRFAARGGDEPHWQIEPWDGPTLVSPLDEPFTWFRIWACILFGFAAPLLIGFLSALFGSLIGFSALSFLPNIVLILLLPLLAILAMQLRTRRGRRRIYWPACVLYTLAFLLIAGAFIFFVGGGPRGFNLAVMFVVGLLPVLAVGCVVCSALDRPRRIVAEE